VLAKQEGARPRLRAATARYVTIVVVGERPRDISSPSLGELDWSPEGRSASLSHVYAHADGLSLQAEQWYSRRRRKKRIGGMCVRVGAIVLGAVILPIVAQITVGADGKPSIEPAWASVVLGTAAALIALDLYFGFTSGWIRFMAAEMQLTRLRHDFEYRWETARARGAPFEELLEHAREFVVAVHAELERETSAWISEFRSNLAVTERGLRPTGSDK
jgi:hypothetical protein